MHPGNAIARLNAKVSSTQFGLGGLPELTNEEIMGALAAVRSRFGQNLLLLVYLNDGTVAAEVREHLRGWIWRKARRECWRVEQRGMVARLADAAMVEHLAPKVCRVCAGRGELSEPPRVVSCEACSGTGVKAMDETLRAQMVGVNYHAWLRLWRVRQEGILAYLSTQHGAAISSVHREFL